jgi:hypothetical protein
MTFFDFTALDAASERHHEMFFIVSDLELADRLATIDPQSCVLEVQVDEEEDGESQTRITRYAADVIRVSRPQLMTNRPPRFLTCVLFSVVRSPSSPDTDA